MISREQLAYTEKGGYVVPEITDEPHVAATNEKEHHRNELDYGYVKFKPTKNVYVGYSHAALIK